MSVLSSQRVRAAIAVASLAGLFGCATPYKPPTAAQPHAILKLRRTYQSSAGLYLRESVSIDGHEAFAAQDGSQAAGAARTDAILIHPTTAELHVAAGFFHTEMRMVQEAYTVQVPYSASESYSCGSGTTYRTCTRMVTRYRGETRYRSVMRSVEVSDGSCGTAVWLSPALNATYVVEYEYAGDTLCRLACFDQVPGAEPGTFANRECRPPSPLEIKRAKKAR